MIQLRNNTLFVDEARVPSGLSWIQLAERQLNNTFKVDTCYVYSERLPAYAVYFVGEGVEFTPDPIQQSNAYEISKCFIHDGQIVFVLVAPDTVYDRNKSYEMRNMARAVIRNWKKNMRSRFGVTNSNYHIYRGA